LPSDEEKLTGPLNKIIFSTKVDGTSTKIALSANSRYLAVSSEQAGLLLYDVSTGQQQTLWASGAASVTSLKFTPEGERVMAGLSDQTARVWSTADGQPQIVIDVGHIPRDIAWSEEASLLATAGGDVKLWECAIPQERN
jgi:WD40 repeat protein